MFLKKKTHISYNSHICIYMFPKKKKKRFPKKRYGFSSGFFNWNKSSHQNRGHFRQHPQVEPASPLKGCFSTPELRSLEVLEKKTHQGCKWGFLKWWVFPNKNHGFSYEKWWFWGVKWGTYHHFFRKTPKNEHQTQRDLKTKKHVAFFFEGWICCWRCTYGPNFENNQRRYNDGNCLYPLT